MGQRGTGAIEVDLRRLEGLPRHTSRAVYGGIIIDDLLCICIIIIIIIIIDDDDLANVVSKECWSCDAAES
jgi:hypothetical protein